MQKNARSDVGQVSDTGGLARRTSAPKGSGAFVSEESRPRVPLESGGGAGGALEGPHGAVMQRIPEQIRIGRTARAISTATGASKAFVSTLLEYYDRLEMFDGIGSLCSSELGACHTKDVSDEVRVAYAGCPPVI